MGISGAILYANETYSIPKPAPVFADMHPGIPVDYKGYEPNDMGAQMADLGAQILAFADESGSMPGLSVQRYLGGSAVMVKINQDGNDISMWLRAGRTLSTSKNSNYAPYPLEQVFVSEDDGGGESTAQFTFGEDRRWSLVTFGGDQENYVYWGDRKTPLLDLPSGFLVEPGRQAQIASLFVNLTLDGIWNAIDSIGSADSQGSSGPPGVNPASLLMPSDRRQI